MKLHKYSCMSRKAQKETITKQPEEPLATAVWNGEQLMCYVCGIELTNIFFFTKYFEPTNNLHIFHILKVDRFEGFLNQSKIDRMMNYHLSSCNS